MSKKAKSKATKTVDATKKYFNPRVRAEHWDADYLDKLSDKDKEWYLRFMSESVNASIIKDKKTGKPAKGSIHKKKKHLKEIYDANNKRNNDLFGVTKVNKLLEYDVSGSSDSKDIWHETNPESVEEALIWAIDYKNNPTGTKRNYKKKLRK